MGEQSIPHGLVCLDISGDIFTVDPNRYPHEQVLRTLDDAVVHLEKVGLLQRLDSEVRILIVSGVDYGAVVDLFFLTAVMRFIDTKGRCSL